MKKLITLITLVAFVLTFSAAAFAAESTDTSLVIENSITTDSLADSGTALIESKDLWTQIKSVNTSIKTEWKSLKEELKSMDKAEAQKLLTDLKAKIEPARTQVKTLHTDIKSLRAQKQTEWTNFRTAVKAKDEAKANTALTNIIELKKQIIAKQKELLPLKQQILEAIKA